MKCLGRTTKLKRCKNNSKFLGFCHQHRFQPFAYLFSLLSIIGLIGGIFQDVWKPLFQPSDITHAKLELVDLIVEVTDSFPKLDLKLINNSDEVIFIKRVEIETIDSWLIDSPANFSMVSASWEYDIDISDKKGGKSKVDVSQAIKPKDVDRFKLAISGKGKTVWGLTPHLIKVNLIYNEDDKELITPKILLDIPANVLVMGTFRYPWSKSLASENKRISKEILSKIDTNTIMSDNLLMNLKTLAELDINEFE